MTRSLISIVILLTLTSCAGINTPVVGMLYTDTQAGNIATSERLASSKKGEACIESILGIARGDASINTAAKQGRIKNITHVDHTAKNILGIYVEYCTIVYGR